MVRIAVRRNNLLTRFFRMLESIYRPISKMCEAFTYEVLEDVRKCKTTSTFKDKEFSIMIAFEGSNTSGSFISLQH